MINCVIFDFGGVLLDWDLRYLFEKLIDDPAELDWFLNNVVTREWHFQADQGVSLDQMIKQRSTEFPAHTHLIQAYGDRFNETIAGFIDGVPQIIEDLAQRDVPLYAITNFGSEFFARYRASQPIFDYFRGILVSGDEKLFKPDPAIFALAQCRFAIEPGNAIFIDDVAANVEAARKAGFAVHDFTDAGRLRGELNGLGLLI